ncbi:ABC transporter ATP-binding protein [Desulfitibacter alkalitolerans]|uniref:ABC transporter ATP-binding protein n=1 Tax=Desulfitibacter alkalitolerans TaxID=264641 RepID=UPI000487319E|nr:ABC transporter ATP-binding protein [Desulfitibacter alkalitolerans]
MIKLENITKTYKNGKLSVEVLKGITIDIGDGEMVAIMGPSGSGKSTLMNILGCLDVPTSGVYLLNNQEIQKKSGRQLAIIRNRELGFIFQKYNLIPQLTAEENVEMPLIYRGIATRERIKRTREALDRVGLSHRIKHRPTEMSGGEQQRVAIARALAAEPHVLLADEPTGNLDTKTGEEIMAIFQELNDHCMTLVLVTHDGDIAQHCKRLIKIQDGIIIGDSKVESRINAREALAELNQAKAVVS